MAIPLLGRLSLGDYRRMVLTWILIVFEVILRMFVIVWSTLSLPFNIPFVLGISKRFDRFFPSLRRWEKSAEMPTNMLHPLASLKHVNEMAAYWGYAIEEYAVITNDGYILALHRLKPHSGPRSAGTNNRKKKPLLMWHGFMMNSEVWLAHPGSKSNNMALVLADEGYDVWLANARGNKYSMKHSKLKPTDKDFWDFCLDDIAMSDVPAIVDFILTETGYSNLTYIGFSQGTTIMFAALSILPKLRQKINCFIAMAPSTKPYGLTNSFISSAVKSSPELIYLIFGRRSLLSSVHFYQSIIPPFLYVTMIDTAVSILFNWKSKNMSVDTKAAVYQHLYSLCSVKLMVHWFQIIREGRFQMYDDIGRVVGNTSVLPKKVKRRPTYASTDSSASVASNVVLRDILNLPERESVEPVQKSSPISMNLDLAAGHITPRYPTEQLKYSKSSENKDSGPPIALFYGGSDSLLDMRALLEGLRFPLENIDIPVDNNQESILLFDTDQEKKKMMTDSPVIYLKCIAPYEHLCFLWADNIESTLTPDILKLVSKYNS